jgi:hypothetical protein
MLQYDFEGKIETIGSNRCEGVTFKGRLGIREVQELCKALENNTTLKRLYFTEARLGCYGLRDICETIKEHPAIETLFIRGGLISSPKQSLGIFLRENKSIKELCIINSELSKRDLRDLFDLVKESRISAFILLIDGADQSVVIDGAVKLIVENRISQLNLPVCDINYSNSIRLREALKNNTSLKSLLFDEYRCKISQGSLEPLLQGISAHPLLVKLMLGTLESNDDYVKLITFLASNKVLEDIRISNELGPAHLKYAIDSLKSNHRLIFFTYQDHFSGSEQEEELFADYRKQLNDMLGHNQICNYPR